MAVSSGTPCTQQSHHAVQDHQWVCRHPCCSTLPVSLTRPDQRPPPTIQTTTLQNSYSSNFNTVSSQVWSAYGMLYLPQWCRLRLPGPFGATWHHSPLDGKFFTRTAVNFTSKRLSLFRVPAIAPFLHPSTTILILRDVLYRKKKKKSRSTSIITSHLQSKWSIRTTYST